MTEPDLILTDDETLIAASITGRNELIAYMGMRSVLFQWHMDDPVDAVDQGRNDAVFSFQGNRNPFVDHPEWVSILFAGPTCMTKQDCDDGLFCNGQEVCDTGTCMGGSDPCPGQGWE